MIKYTQEEEDWSPDRGEHVDVPDPVDVQRGAEPRVGVQGV